ncbi:MAG: hypothetical protein HY232_20080 [Acidobacteria bacterium]|nr:hypothetical protein [Acidobacteriota bacterium]
MIAKRPPPPRPDLIRSIRGSFSWIDHRFLRQGFDQGLTRLEKLLYFVLVAVSNQDGISFYSDQRLGELLDIRYPHELTGARDELVARDLIAYAAGIYQVLQLPSQPATAGKVCWKRPPAVERFGSDATQGAASLDRQQDRSTGWKSLRQLLAVKNTEDEEGR